MDSNYQSELLQARAECAKLRHQNDLYRAMRRVDYPGESDVAREQRRTLEMLVRLAWEHAEISTGRATEILGLGLMELREKMAVEGWNYKEHFDAASGM